MNSTLIDGIETRYDVIGQGPALLMFSPGGFDARRQRWSSLGIYARTRMLEHLAQRYRCVIFDRRESGESGGRIQCVTWRDYAVQGRGLLDHLGIERAFLIGGCMGCPPALTFAATWPESTLGIVLYWPVGGARYRIAGVHRFAQHLAFVQEHGLAGVAELANSGDKSFGEDPRAGPWVTVLRRDAAFAAAFVAMNEERYRLAVLGTQHALLDRDTAPGPEPERLLGLDVPALIVPGRDDSHATSAARYLEECLPHGQYWDAEPAAQTEPAVSQRLFDFFDAHRPAARA
jgi:pimeloyl-ACP methyl ester carboxylesterase